MGRGGRARARVRLDYASGPASGCQRHRQRRHIARHPRGHRGRPRRARVAGSSGLVPRGLLQLRGGAVGAARHRRRPAARLQPRPAHDLRAAGGPAALLLPADRDHVCDSLRIGRGDLGPHDHGHRPDHPLDVRGRRPRRGGGERQPGDGREGATSARSHSAVREQLVPPRVAPARPSQDRGRSAVSRSMPTSVGLPAAFRR